MRTLSKRQWYLVGLAVILAAAVVFFLLRSRSASRADWQESFREVAVESILHQDSVEISGNLEPLRARDLAFPVSGKVVEVTVQAGGKVAQGALVARLDAQAARYELSLSEGTLEQKRYSASPRELNNLQLERDLKAQAVRDRELRAPFTGTITEVEILPGDFAAAGRKVVRLADLSALKAKVQIDELDAPRVNPGLPVRFAFDALPALEVQGRVSSLSVEGRITSDGLAVLDGEVVIDRPPPGLLSGYSFTGEILLGEEQKLLVLPRAALWKEGGRTFVYLAGNDGLARQEVTAAVLGEELLRILSGLSAGDRVLVPLDDGKQQGVRLTATGLLKTMKGRIRLPNPSGGAEQSGPPENGNR